MAILTDVKKRIDLSGPDGNAFCLLGYASSFSKQLGYTKEKSDSIQKEMQSGDYDNLVDTFDKYFGDYVDLVF